jgi:hypothetical protein
MRELESIMRDLETGKVKLEGVINTYKLPVTFGATSAAMPPFAMREFKGVRRCGNPVRMTAKGREPTVRGGRPLGAHRGSRT